jgi:hypothetical protein
VDIFSFAQEYLLFFRLQAKLNFHYNDRTRSGLFLPAVQSSQFADTITLLQSHINSYQEEFEDGYLPPNLCLHGLATSLNQNALSRIRDIATPALDALDATSPFSTMPPHVSRVSHQSTALSAFTPCSATMLTGETMAIYLAGEIIPIALARFAFLRRRVFPTIGATAVTALNTDRDARPAPIATVDPT